MNNIEIKSCYLKSNENVSALYLPDKQSVVLGRSLQTQIINKKCSKRQCKYFLRFLRKHLKVTFDVFRSFYSFRISCIFQ